MKFSISIGTLVMCLAASCSSQNSDSPTDSPTLVDAIEKGTGESIALRPLCTRLQWADFVGVAKIEQIEQYSGIFDLEKGTNVDAYVIVKLKVLDRWVGDDPGAEFKARVSGGPMTGADGERVILSYAASARVGEEFVLISKHLDDGTWTFSNYSAVRPVDGVYTYEAKDQVVSGNLQEVRAIFEEAAQDPNCEPWTRTHDVGVFSGAGDAGQ